MGSVYAKKIYVRKNTKIIDYASKYRTDFGDIYLPAKCKFFLGNTAGIYQVSTIFDIVEPVITGTTKANGISIMDCGKCEHKCQ
jgi:putative glycosyltransferase (TIGR04372 family)